MGALTRKEYVIKALKHEKTDIVPFHLDFTKQAYENIVKFTKDSAFLNNSGTFLHYFQYWGWPTEIQDKKEHFLDAFGVTWNRSGADKDIGVIDKPIINAPDILLYPEPNFDEERLRAEIEITIAKAGDRFVFAGIGFSMFERLWSYCGMEDALMYMLIEPEFTHQLLDKICDFNMKILNIINEYPLDGVYFGDDWGQQKGLIMGPRLWCEFIKPQMAKMYKCAKKNGKFILQHSCGDILEIMPDLIEIGLDCYQTFQPEIYNIEDVKKKFGKDLAFWGGISTQQLLPYATPDVIKQEIRRIIDIMKIDGGYISAPTHAITFDIPAENIIAMLEVFKEYKY